MSVIVLDKKEIERVKKNAEENIVSLEQLKAIIKGDPAPIPGDDGDFTLYSGGVKIVYTHEQQLNGICRHISVSINKPDMLPEPTVVNCICKEFGFINELPNLIFWVEKFGDETQIAVNLVEPLDGDFSNHIKDKENSE